MRLFRASGSTKYTSFIDIDIGIKNTLKHYNKAAEAAIKTKSLCNIFFGDTLYFDTATFDDIERDKKIKTEAQLSLIGGTIRLITGFSIISGVEIVFFLIR